MNDGHRTPIEIESETRDLRLHLAGLVASLALTVAAFGFVAFSGLSASFLFWTIFGAAIGQLFVQLRCFLDIDLQKSHRDDLQLILFTGVLAAIMIGGTLWITADQMALMG